MKLFYLLIGMVAALALALVSYGMLRANSSLGLLYVHTSATYVFWFVALSAMSAILFGINTALFVYEWRRFGLTRFFHYGGGGIGAVVSIFASVCPVCGSAVVSAIGAISGLATLPFQGLEVKIAATLVLVAATIYSVILLRQKNCHGAHCPAPRDDRLKRWEQRIYIPLLVTSMALCIVAGWQWFAGDSIRSPEAMAQARYSCTAKK